jgi:hypothetical protein
VRPVAAVLAFLDRLGELAEAHALERRIGILRMAVELAPAAAPALDARVAELRAERLALDPPVLLCPYCGYEWAGRRRPQLRCYGRGGGHGWIVDAWKDVQESGQRRDRDELPEDFRRRMATWWGEAGSIWRDEPDEVLDDRPRTVARA